MPDRIQLQRTAGWRLPLNAKTVARPTIYGNPWRITNFGTAREPLWAVIGPTRGIPRVADETSRASAHERAVDIYRKWLDDWVMDWPAEHHDRYAHARQRILNRLPELRGRTLACWCPLTDQTGKPLPCHADVLIELARA